MNDPDRDGRAASVIMDPIPPALPLEGLSGRVAAVLRAGHRFNLALVYAAARCGSPECRRGDALLDQLHEPVTREATAWLLDRARNYSSALLGLFEAVCFPEHFTHGVSPEEAADASIRACRLLADDLGVPLVAQVRAMALRAFGDRTGRCPFCSAGVCSTPAGAEP